MPGFTMPPMPMMAKKAPKKGAKKKKLPAFLLKKKGA